MNVSGPDSHKPTYRDEFHRSVELFEKSFHGASQSSFDAQREQYVKVMHESLHIMQEASTNMLNAHLASLKEDLAKDLDHYLKDPSDAQKSKIESDISRLKDSS